MIAAVLLAPCLDPCTQRVQHPRQGAVIAPSIKVVLNQTGAGNGTPLTSRAQHELYRVEDFTKIRAPATTQPVGAATAQSPLCIRHIRFQSTPIFAYTEQ